ncbi:hypothetical protein ACHAWF_018725 [Thalassiosira exigua]
MDLPRRVSESSLGDAVPQSKELSHFPFKLYDMLEYAADSEHAFAVSWIDEGRAFAIHDKEAFMKRLVPMFFKQTKFRSFTRQLNLWGFRRFCERWEHKHFVRGRVENIRLIERMEIKGTMTRSSGATRITKAKRSAARGASRSGFVGTRLEASPPLEPIDGCVSPVSQDAASASSVPEDSSMRTAASFPVLPRANGTISSHGHVSVAHLEPRGTYAGFADSSHSHRADIADATSAHSHTQQNVNQDDILFVLSGLFGIEESSKGDDLSSIFSLDEVSDDFMNPISL